jgi:hypothetical protein
MNINRAVAAGNTSDNRAVTGQIGVNVTAITGRNTRVRIQTITPVCARIVDTSDAVEPLRRPRRWMPPRPAARVQPDVDHERDHHARCIDRLSPRLQDAAPFARKTPAARKSAS